MGRGPNLYINFMSIIKNMAKPLLELFIKSNDIETWHGTCGTKILQTLYTEPN